MAFVSAAPDSQPGANQSSLAWEHEVPTSGLLMLIAVAVGGDGSDFVATTTPTVGGVPATPVPDSLLTRDDTTLPYGLRLWYVLDPATTEGVASVAFAPGQNMFSPCGVSLLYGDVGGVGDGVQTAIESGNPVSSALDVASEVGGMVADVVQFHWHEAGREPAPTGDNTGNQHIDAVGFAGNNGARIRASSAPGAATVNMDWANAGGAMSLMHVAVPLTPAASGGTTENITGTSSGTSSDSATAPSLAVSITGASAGSSTDSGTDAVAYAIFGTVLDGATPEAGAEVYLIDLADDSLYGMQETDESGEYRFDGVPAGSYHATVYVSGKTARSQNVTVG